MAFEQTRDILEKARGFHRDLAAYFERLERVAQQEKVRMVLEYLRRHEQAMDEELKSFEARAERPVLDSWFKYAPESVQETIARLEIRPDMTVEEVVAIALKLDEQLLELYGHAARLAPDADARELFANLHREGLRERARILRAVHAAD